MTNLIYDPITSNTNNTWKEIKENKDHLLAEKGGCASEHD